MPPATFVASWRTGNTGIAASNRAFGQRFESDSEASNGTARTLGPVHSETGAAESGVMHELLRERGAASFRALQRLRSLRWVFPFAFDRAARRFARELAPALHASWAAPPAHLLVALCDHFEPLHGMATLDRGVERVRAWRSGYPALATAFRDGDGLPPRHTFFYPGEQYRPELLEPLAELCEAGLAEVEVHLHHDGETRVGLRRWIERTLRCFGDHGLVPHDGAGRPRWAFIHGNWALANARRDGRYCGVDDELAELFDCGCYADFTFPAAPDPCQPPVVNALFYPRGNPSKRRAHERAVIARVNRARRDRVLLVSGPLALARRPGKVLPRVEAGAITAADPGTAERVQRWLDCSVHVRGRPEWLLVKLHTHGAPEGQAQALLGGPQRRLHEALASACRTAGLRLHYVTAREMYNIAMAAMDGKCGDPAEYRDYEVSAPARSGREPTAGGNRAETAPGRPHTEAASRASTPSMKACEAVATPASPNNLR
jgi:hypothetical protein